MQNFFIFLILLIGVTQVSHAMEESHNKQFLTAQSEQKWINGIIQMVSWSQELPNKYQNKMIQAYQSCYEKIKKLQEEERLNITHEFLEEIAFAEHQLLPQLITEKDVIKKLKIILASHKIIFPSDQNKKDPEWQKKSNQALFMLNEKTSATPLVIIASSLIPYKMVELRNHRK